MLAAPTQPDRGVRRLFRSCRLACSLVAGLGFARLYGADGLVEQPLAAKSGPRGSTMFKLLPPEQTGVVTENRYADPRMWIDRFQEFTLGAIGTGVAIGDYDNDGRPDLFIVSKTESCRLFRNLGGWKFEDVTERAGLMGPAGSWSQGLAWVKNKLGDAAPAADPGIWKQGAVFVDVNNDGLLDLYVCRFGAPNLLYINQGNGTFKEEAAARGLAVNDASGMAAFCDYDRDGWLDLYLQTNMLDGRTHPTGQRDYLFHNNGDGTFTNVTDRAGMGGETQGHSAIWWDYDGDGWPDLYVANDFAVPDFLYHNNRDGTFTNVISRVVPHTPYSSMGSDLGDVNNDGLIDYFVPDMAATTHEKDQRGMVNSRMLNTEEPEDSPAASQYAHNALYVNTGIGVCLEAAHLAGLAATDWTWSPRWEDLDNDGRLDLHATNGMVRELHNLDTLARVMVAESPAERIRVVRQGPVLNESNLAFRNLGDLQFENVGAAWGLDQKGVSFGSAFGDLDGDGDLDIVYTNYQSGATVLRNDCDTGHRLIVALRGTRSNRFGIGATVRIRTADGVQVRPLVLARGILSSSEPIVHFGLGEHDTVEELTVNWPSGEVQTYHQVAADRRLTITEPATGVRPTAAESPRATEFVDVTDAFGLGHRVPESSSAPEVSQPLLPFRQNRRGPALAVSELGPTPAILLGGTTEQAARTLVRDRKAGRFEAHPGPAGAGAALGDGPILAFDAEGTGTDDVLVTRSGAGLSAGSDAYQPALLRPDGAGGWQLVPGALPSLPISVGAASAADFDRDGRLDVFVGGRVIPGRYPLPARSALLRNVGGRFEDVTESVAPELGSLGLVTSALWSDVDGDGWLDLIVALEWDGIRYFHNDHGNRLQDRSAEAGFADAGTGWWTSLASGDLNGDGRPDFVAGNIGLNTQYRATAEHPALLYYGEFRKGRAPLLIEAYFEGDRLLPWKSRKELGQQIPALLQKFPRNDMYARSTLAEIFGEPALKAARQFAATELRSGVFLSQPDGRYRFEPLPRIAQIAPLQGIAVADIDGDGRIDIYAVQNSYAPVPAIGHFDGGVSQLLLGDGKGGFRPVAPAESGLVVRGDAKALVSVDLDGDGRVDFVVSRNNSSTLAFRNNSASGHPLSVALRGPPGNPTGIGSRITVELADGSTETGEISAGAGYFSQSSATCFFGYPDRNPPRRIRVRWPSGAETTHEPTSWPAHLILSSPSS